MINNTYKYLFFFGLMLTSALSSASSFSISPWKYAALPTSILSGQTATAYYIVKNNTPFPQKNIFIRLPTNTTQVVEGGLFSHGSCGASFELAANGTIARNENDISDYCVLELTITGSIDSTDSNQDHHLGVCQNNSDCSMVDTKENELNVLEGKANDLTRVAIVTELSDTPFSDSAKAYTSVDGGINWTPHIIEGFKGTIKIATCAGNSGQSCVAFGRNGAILTAYNSNDGGGNWTAHTTENHQLNSAGINAVTCDSASGRFCVAVGAYNPSKTSNLVAPIVYTSSDGGENWSSHHPQTYSISGPELRAVSCSGNNNQYCTAVGNFYTRGDYSTKRSPETTFVSYRSADGGVTWASSIIGKYQGQAWINSVSCTNENQNCIAVGDLDAITTSRVQKPIIFRSLKEGAPWESYIPEQKLRSTLNAVYCSPNNNQNCLAAGSTGMSSSVYRSIDGGLNWVVHNLGNGTFKSVTCSDNGKHCTILGYEVNKSKNALPTVYTSMNGGETWSSAGYPAFKSSENPVPKIVRNSGIIVTGNTE